MGILAGIRTYPEFHISIWDSRVARIPVKPLYIKLCEAVNRNYPKVNISDLVKRPSLLVPSRLKKGEIPKNEELGYVAGQ